MSNEERKEKAHELAIKVVHHSSVNTRTEALEQLLVLHKEKYEIYKLQHDRTLEVFADYKKEKDAEIQQLQGEIEMLLSAEPTEDGKSLYEKKLEKEIQQLKEEKQHLKEVLKEVTDERSELWKVVFDGKGASQQQIADAFKAGEQRWRFEIWIRSTSEKWRGQTPPDLETYLSRFTGGAAPQETKK